MVPLETREAVAARRTPHPIWSASDLAERQSWRSTLPADVIEEFRVYARNHPAQALDPSPEALEPPQLPRVWAYGQHLRDGLFFGDGVAWIKGAGAPGLTAPEQRLLYLALGASMGRVMDEYGFLYTVEDRGVDYRKEPVPVSMTREATGLHTDSSSVDALPDIVGLLCETPSQAGGESLVSNALNVYARMRAIDPSMLATLSGNFIRDVVTPGKERSARQVLRNAFPIFSPDSEDENRTFRYMRYWIEKGHEEARRPLGPQQTRAMNLLDRLLAAPENCLRLRLEAGDILLTNNRTIAHGRENYADGPGNRRRLQRLWIEARADRRGRTPSRTPE